MYYTYSVLLVFFHIFSRYWLCTCAVQAFCQVLEMYMRTRQALFLALQNLDQQISNQSMTNEHVIRIVADAGRSCESVTQALGSRQASQSKLHPTWMSKSDWIRHRGKEIIVSAQGNSRCEGPEMREWRLFLDLKFRATGAWQWDGCGEGSGEGWSKAWGETPNHAGPSESC